MPIFLELHGMAVPEQVQGGSLRHLLGADADLDEAVLYGGFAKDVCLTGRPLPRRALDYERATRRERSLR